jgi:hypothetical protein
VSGVLIEEKIAVGVSMNFLCNVEGEDNWWV